MPTSPNPLRLEFQGGRLLMITGPADITREKVDAIVNAANTYLAGGSGVDGAIHAAGGPEILEHCRTIVAQQGPLLAGQAVATPAGRLLARYVIHTVGPVWHGGHQGEPEALASCHREAIRVADELQLTSVAFPAISTGIFGYPVELAAPVALGSALNALRNAGNVREVRFVLFDEKTREHFARAAEMLKVFSVDGKAPDV
jgi:O-acetyl-ADP-ribose deacetylase (regulator of RNase III)